MMKWRDEKDTNEFMDIKDFCDEMMIKNGNRFCIITGGD